MSETTHHTVWVAYGANGVVGSIRKDEDGYTATLTGAAASLGVYPTMEIAKSALHSNLRAGADWPEFREH